MSEDKRKDVLQAINMDEWKHGMYIDLGALEGLARSREIIAEKIQHRLSDLSKLTAALSALDYLIKPSDDQKLADIKYLAAIVDTVIESEGVDLEPDDLLILSQVKAEYKL